jgi:hypothetical protein
MIFAMNLLAGTLKSKRWSRLTSNDGGCL